MRNANNRNERRGERRQDQEPKQQKEKGPKTKSLAADKKASKRQDDGEFDFESEQDLKCVFPEIETKQADPVGIPLPAEYTDEPTIPPSYNATCVKSQFFNEDPKEFVMPIRATALWSEARWDPVFKDYPGMIKRRFEGSDIDYATYEPPVPLSPSRPIKMPPRYQIDRTVLQEATPEPSPREEETVGTRGGYSHHRSPDRRYHRDTPPSRHNRDGRVDEWRDDRRFGKRSRDESPEGVGEDGRNLKRSRGSESRHGTPRNGGSRARSPVRRRSLSPRIKIERDPWSPQAGESSGKWSSDNRYLDVHGDNKSSSSREGRERMTVANARHDSGYHSGQSLDKARQSRREDERDRGRRASDRSFPRRRSPSRSPSRSRSPSADDRSSRSESPLTALEAELLGLTDEPPAEKIPQAKAKKAPIKRVKVAAAYE